MQTMMMSSALQTPVCRPSRSASITSRPTVARPMRSSVVVRAEKGGPPPTVRHLIRASVRTAQRAYYSQLSAPISFDARRCHPGVPTVVPT